MLTYPTIFISLFCHLIMSGFNGLLFSLGGLTLGIAIFLIPYLMGGMGAGDVKLMGAVGAVIGPKGVFIAFLMTAIIGGFYALVLLIIQRRHHHADSNRCLEARMVGDTLTSAITTGDMKEPKLCYGFAIAFGTLCYLVLDFSVQL